MRDRTTKQQGHSGRTAVTLVAVRAVPSTSSSPPRRSAAIRAVRRARLLSLMLICLGAGWPAAAHAAATWTQQLPSANPSARSGMGLAYDAAAGVDVGFGGQSQGSSTFGSPQDIDPNGTPWGVSCWASTACAVVDDGGDVVVYNGSWASPQLIDSGHQIYSVSCVNSSCFAADDNGTVFNWAGGSWFPTTVDSGHALRGISCPQTNWCVASDNAGRVFVYSGTSWSAGTTLDSGQTIYSVSCPSTTFCMAVDGNGHGYTYNGTSWSLSLSQSGTWYSVSCTSTTFCVAVNLAGKASVYNGTSWSTAATIGGGASLYGVSCTASTFCTAIDGSGNALTYNGSTWSSKSAGLAAGRGISCVSSSFCVAVDINGGEAQGASSTSWTYNAIDGSALGGAPQSVECITSSFCLAGDSGGHVMQWNGNSWSAPTQIDSGGGIVYAISCVTTSFCLAADKKGDIVSYNGSSWSVNALDSGHQLRGVSCASASLCVAVDDAGRAFTYNGSSWGAATTIDSGHALVSVSCATTTMCMAVDNAGNAVLFNGSSWGAVSAMDSSRALTAVYCYNQTFCFATDGSGYAVKYTGSWAAPVQIDAASGLAGVSCGSTTFCLAVDYGGNALTYNGSAWSSTSVDPGNALSAVSCSSISYCALVDSVTNAIIYSPSATYDSDTWTYNATTDVWTNKAPASAPAARTAVAMAYDTATQQIVLFGGSAGSTYFSDTWVYSVATNSWTQESPATHPSARDHAQMTYDPVLGKILLTGGQNGGTANGETWSFDPATDTWTNLSPSGSIPTVAGAAFGYVAGMGMDVLFGGDPGGGGAYTAMTLFYNPSTNAWSWQSPATSPTGRAYGSSAATPTQLIELGGSSGSGSSNLNDTWSYSPSTWTQQSPASKPSPRNGAAMTYDASAGVLVLFGGQNGTSVYSDTWTGSFQTLNLEASPTLSWSPTLSGYDLHSDAASTITITDTAGAGWNVQVSGSTLSAGANTLPPLVLNGSAATSTASTAPSASCVSGSMCTLPTGNSALYPLSVPTSTPSVLFNASSGTGTDGVNLALDWWLSVPGSAKAGTYSSTVTVTVASGP